MPQASIISEQDSRMDPDELRLNRRDVDEFLGLCRAFSVDGHISDAELEAVTSWLRRSGRIAGMPLVSKVHAMLDGLPEVLSPQARAMALDVLRQLTGEIDESGRISPTTLPLTAPPPELTFEGKRYCLTGTFDYGSRTACENAIRRRGGSIKRKITLDTDVLVIGTGATDTWLHSSYGAKISTAMRWRQNQKVDIPIVSEEHWRAQIAQFPPIRSLADVDLESAEDPIELAIDLADHGEISRDRFEEITGGLPFPGDNASPSTSSRPLNTYRDVTEHVRAFPVHRAPKKQGRSVRYWWAVIAVFVVGYVLTAAAVRMANKYITEPTQQAADEVAVDVGD